MKCLKCGKNIELSGNYHIDAQIHRKKYCSKKCRNNFCQYRWAKSHLERIRKISINHWNKKYFGKGIREAILQRDDNRCTRCKTTKRLHIHHLRPKQFGGSNELDNLITLCISCHSKEERDVAQKAIKFFWDNKS